MSPHNLIQNQFAEKRGDEEVTGKFVREDIDLRSTDEGVQYRWDAFFLN